MSYSPVNEGSTAYLRVTLKNKDGAVESASSGLWKVTDVSTDEIMLAEAALPAPYETGKYLLEIPSTANAMKVPANRVEYRRVTIKASYGIDGHYNCDFVYEVVNLTDV